MEYTQKELDIAGEALARTQGGLQGLTEYTDNAHQVRYVMEHTGYTWDESEALLDYMRKRLSAPFPNKPDIRWQARTEFGSKDLLLYLTGGLLFVGVGGFAASISFSSFDIGGLICSVPFIGAGIVLLIPVWRFIRGRDPQVGIRLRKTPDRNVQAEAPATESSTAPTDSSTAPTMQPVQDVRRGHTKIELKIAQKAIVTYQEHDEQVAFIREQTGCDQEHAEMLITQMNELFERGIVQARTWSFKYTKVLGSTFLIPFLLVGIAALMVSCFPFLNAILNPDPRTESFWLSLGVTLVLGGGGIWIIRISLRSIRRIANAQLGRDFYGIRGSDVLARNSRIGRSHSNSVDVSGDGGSSGGHSNSVDVSGDGGGDGGSSGRAG